VLLDEGGDELGDEFLIAARERDGEFEDLLKFADGAGPSDGHVQTHAR
jgi:hypothetical protein